MNGKKIDRQRLLAAYAETGTISGAAKAAGCSRTGARRALIETGARHPMLTNVGRKRAFNHARAEAMRLFGRSWDAIGEAFGVSASAARQAVCRGQR